jgi:hypothetical protein
MRPAYVHTSHTGFSRHQSSAVALLLPLVLFLLLPPLLLPWLCYCCSYCCCCCSSASCCHACGLQGFMSEILRKYNIAIPATPGRAPTEARPGLVVYEAFQDCFNMLPLATLIEKDGRKVFVCHGGLFERPGVKLSHISAIKVPASIFPSIHSKRILPRISFSDSMYCCLLLVACAAET